MTRGEWREGTVRPQCARYSSLTTVRKRILVVDDNLGSAESLTVLLELTGHETRAAYDALEALEAAEQFRRMSFWSTSACLN